LDRTNAEPARLLTGLQKSGAMQSTDATTPENHRKEIARIQAERAGPTSRRRTY
jgi:hypothetical protein